MTSPPAAPPLGNTPSAPINPTARKADDFWDYPRDQWERPLIVQLNPDGSVRMVNGEPLAVAYTRASRMGSALEYQGALNSYHVRNAVIGVIGSEPLLMLARSVHEPGGAGRQQMDKEVIKPAQMLAGASNAAAMGTALHAFAEKHDRGEPVPALGDYQQTLDAYVALTRGWRWRGIETRLVSDRFRAAGKTDRLGSPPGWMVAPDGTIIGPDDVVVLDLKTSSSARYFGVKFAVQLAVYAHGDEYDLTTHKRTPTGARTDWGLVAHVPSGGNSGALYWVNLTRGTELVGLARQVLDAQGERGLVPPVAMTHNGTAYYASRDEAEAAARGELAPAAFARLEPVPSADEGDPEPSTVQPTEPDPAEVAATAEVTGESEHEVEQRLAVTTTVPESVTAAIPADLGPSLQRRAEVQRDPAAQVAREVEAVRTAPPRGGLEAVRERYAGSWTPEHEAAAVRRGWELGVLAALERASTLDALRAVWAEVSGYGAWTDEMDRVILRRGAEVRGDEADS